MSWKSVLNLKCSLITSWIQYVGHHSVILQTDIFLSYMLLKWRWLISAPVLGFCKDTSAENLWARWGGNVHSGNKPRCSWLSLVAVTGSLAPRGVRESVPGKKAMRKDIFKCFNYNCINIHWKNNSRDLLNYFHSINHAWASQVVQW